MDTSVSGAIARVIWRGGGILPRPDDEGIIEGEHLYYGYP